MSTPNNPLVQNNLLTLQIDPLKFINSLPEFSGDYKELQTFINLVDRVIPILERYDDFLRYN